MDKINIVLRCKDWTQKEFDAFYEWFSNEMSTMNMYTEGEPVEVESYEVIHEQ